MPDGCDKRSWGGSVAPRRRAPAGPGREHRALWDGSGLQRQLSPGLGRNVPRPGQAFVEATRGRVGSPYCRVNIWCRCAAWSPVGCRTPVSRRQSCRSCGACLAVGPSGLVPAVRPPATGRGCGGGSRGLGLCHTNRAGLVLPVGCCLPLAGVSTTSFGPDSVTDVVAVGRQLQVAEESNLVIRFWRPASVLTDSRPMSPRRAVVCVAGRLSRCSVRTRTAVAGVGWSHVVSQRAPSGRGSRAGLVCGVGSLRLDSVRAACMGPAGLSLGVRRAMWLPSAGVHRDGWVGARPVGFVMPVGVVCRVWPAARVVRVSWRAPPWWPGWVGWWGRSVPESNRCSGICSPVPCLSANGSGWGWSGGGPGTKKDRFPVVGAVLRCGTGVSRWAATPCRGQVLPS